MYSFTELIPLHGIFYDGKLRKFPNIKSNEDSKHGDTSSVYQEFEQKAEELDWIDCCQDCMMPRISHGNTYSKSQIFYIRKNTKIDECYKIGHIIGAGYQHEILFNQYLLLANKLASKFDCSLRPKDYNKEVMHCLTSDYRGEDTIEVCTEFQTDRE